MWSLISDFPPEVVMIHDIDGDSCNRSVKCKETFHKAIT
jgi:hypothetical protein